MLHLVELTSFFLLSVDMASAFALCLGCTLATDEMVVESLLTATLTVDEVSAGLAKN